MKRAGALFLSIFIILIQSSAPAFADYQLQDSIKEFGEKRWIKTGPTRIKAGPLRIHPYLKTKFEFDDNVYLSHSKARKDFVFDVAPGAVIEIPIDRHQVTVGYEGDIETLAINSTQNTQDQHFFALGDFNFPSWYLNVLEKLDITSDRAGTTFTSRIPRIDQLVNPKLGYRWKRMTFEGGFRQFIRDFQRTVDKPFDFQERAWTGVLYYDLFARLKALADYTFSQIEYPGAHTRNSHLNQ
ncbi:MAG: outer membrane beta-barrel protein, partial [Candidatus Omnitrophota bacterium]